MGDGGFEETRIEQPAVPLFLVAWPLVGGSIGASVLLRSSAPVSGLLLAYVTVDAILAIVMTIYLYKLSKSPAYVIVRRDELVLKRAFRSKEEVYPYADMLYFESRLVQRSRGVESWRTFGVRRSPQGRVNLPTLGGRTTAGPRGRPTNDNADVRVFRLLKAALESWQLAQGMIVEPRLADRDSDVLT